MHAFCYASGQIGFGRSTPKGAICFAKGAQKVLRDAIEPAARLAYGNETLLVPGVPEAETQNDGITALYKWLDWRRDGWVAKGLWVHATDLAKKTA